MSCVDPEPFLTRQELDPDSQAFEQGGGPVMGVEGVISFARSPNGATGYGTHACAI
mgnify:CR=1 FL=1